MKKIFCLIFIMLILMPLVLAQGGFLNKLLAGFGGSNEIISPNPNNVVSTHGAELPSQAKWAMELDKVRGCEDTDMSNFFPEGRLAFNKKGKVTAILDDGAETTFSDTCLDENNLVEYYCGKDGSIKHSKVFCLNGCNEGKCSEPIFCIDIDKKNNIHIQGTLYFLDLSTQTPFQNKANDLLEKFRDFCLNEKVLVQYSCGSGSNKGIVEKQYECEYGCKEGECLIDLPDGNLPATSLNDNDGISGKLQSEQEENEEIIVPLGETVEINGVDVTVQEDGKKLLKKYNVLEGSKVHNYVLI